MICQTCYVSGRVQNVFYRASTRSQARRLGLTGHAINLSDGRVEVLMCGSQQQLEILESWLWEGPSLSAVSDVQCQRSETSDATQFTTD